MTFQNQVSLLYYITPYIIDQTEDLPAAVPPNQLN